MRLTGLISFGFFTACVTQKVLLKRTNVELTVYYDNSVGRGEPDTCSLTHKWGTAWQTELLKDVGSCGGQTYAGRGDDRMVALGGIIEPKLYCGKRIRLTGPDGKVFKLDNKDFYIKDTCGGCGSEKLDISGWAMRQMYDGVCGVSTPDGAINMPKGWTVEILDEDEPDSGLNNARIEDGQLLPAAAVNPYRLRAKSNPSAMEIRAALVMHSARWAV